VENGVSFLVAEDDVRVGRILARALSAHGSTELVQTVAEARERLAVRAFSALVVDVGLPDGSGLQVARIARARDSSVPVLFLSGRVDATRLAEAHTLDAHYLLKPIDVSQLEVFALRVLSRSRVREARIHGAVAQWAHTHDLTGTEAALLELAARGAARSELAVRREVAPSTIKKQIQTLLDKTGDGSLDAAVNRLLRMAIDGR
jgi:DNA-binding NarL/FixJ family response regulator